MASERQAAEQARQAQAIRNLEQEKQQLQKDLLQLQLQQEQQRKDGSDNLIVGYPPLFLPALSSAVSAVSAVSAQSVPTTLYALAGLS